MQTKQIQVLIVDDSKVSRDLLAYIVESDDQLKVMGFAENGEEAIEFLKNHKPDVVITDIVMPKLDGFKLTKQIMDSQPIPIIIVTGIYNKEEVSKSFKAISAGAITVLEKPKGIGDACYLDTARFVIDTIKAISQFKFDKAHHLPPLKPQTPSESPQTDTPKLKTEDKHISTKAVKAIAIGASLGGPQALCTLLSSLPSNLPVPILIAQHISNGFIQGLVNWLSESTFLKIHIAKNGEKALPGSVYIAPDKSLMEITPDNIIRIQNTPSEGVPPSIGHLFRSVGNQYGSEAIGILLTGIGSDGAEDLLYMKQKGSTTLVQDEESCVRFDLPRAAIKLGAAQQILPLPKMASLIQNMIDANTWKSTKL